MLWGLRFLGKSSLLSKTDQPAAAEQRRDLSCARGEMLQHSSNFSIALVLEEMKAGHEEKLMRENNRAGRAAGAQNTADLFWKNNVKLFWQNLFWSGREALPCVISSKVPELPPFLWLRVSLERCKPRIPHPRNCCFSVI